MSMYPERNHNPRVGGSSPSSAIQVDRKFNGSSRSLYAVMSDGLRPAMPRSLALASFRLESSPSSAIQVDRKFNGSSRSLYAVMSDGLRAAMPRSLALASFRLESSPSSAILCEPRVQWGLAVVVCGHE